MVNIEAYTFDVEGTGLIDESTVDYTCSPVVKRDNFKLHCAVVHVLDTDDIIAFYDGDTYELDGREYKEEIDGEIYELSGYDPVKYIHLPWSEFETFIKANPKAKVIGHNIINYDLLATKLTMGIDYSVGDVDTWADTEVNFRDTLVQSKYLNPDRLGGHSLDNLGKKVGLNKIEFRKHMPVATRFKVFAADMIFYCIRDVLVNSKVYKYLEKEAEDWDWSDCDLLEKRVADIITRQSHRGFKFNSDAAVKCVQELDAMLQEITERVTPIIPDKPITKTAAKEFTPPAKQIKKNLEPTSYLLNFAEKHGGVFSEDFTKLTIFGKTHDLPMPQETLVTHIKAGLSDTTHIKEWLVSLGWEPLGWKERDLTVDQKKIKLDREAYEKVVHRYVEQTLNSNFLVARCEHLHTDVHGLLDKLLKHDTKKPMKVLTNPTFTIGQDKELCPNLLLMEDEFPYAKDITNWLTYRHRRNSILGGGMEWDDDEEPEKGYLASVREDGRIPTPADTCGAGTSRFKHKLVANIPRTTSLYGVEMRNLFGVDDGYVQIGYDFDSLEARMEAHYCWRYDLDKVYCNSLTQPKPFDVHTLLAASISDIISREFKRNPAKNVKYGCLPVESSQILTKDGWKSYAELVLGEEVLTYSDESGGLVWDRIQDIQFYADADVVQMQQKGFNVECTEDHRWFGKYRTGGRNTRRIEKGFFRVFDITGEQSILASAPLLPVVGDIPPDIAEFFGWLLSDGYYKWSEKEEVTSSSNGIRKGVIGSIAQDSSEYVDELQNCLNVVGAPYTLDQRGSMKIFRLKSKWLREVLDKYVGRSSKHDVDWVKLVLRMDIEALERFYQGFFLADGHTLPSGRRAISQNRGNIFDAIRLTMFLLGKNCGEGDKGNGKCFTIAEKASQYVGTQRMQIVPSGKKDVFCVTTGNGTFVMRQGKYIGITGNCTYGAQGARVAKTIGCDLKTGEKIFNAFWEAAAPLKKLKDKLTFYWENIGGKKFILGIDGRKIPTRSAHAILNSLFQSAGVICAKRAMVIHDQKLKDAGLSVDFFKDDWANSVFVQQLIAYHK